MASPTWWTWVWVSSGSWWWTGKPGVLQSMGSQRVRHDWATELNWKLFIYVSKLVTFKSPGWEEWAERTRKKPTPISEISDWSTKAWASLALPVPKSVVVDKHSLRFSHVFLHKGLLLASIISVNPTPLVTQVEPLFNRWSNWRWIRESNLPRTKWKIETRQNYCKT